MDKPDKAVLMNDTFGRKRSGCVQRHICHFDDCVGPQHVYEKIHIEADTSSHMPHPKDLRAYSVHNYKQV